MLARQKATVNHQVHALTGREHRLDRGARRQRVQLAQLVHPYASGVDHTCRLDGKVLPGFLVLT